MGIDAHQHLWRLSRGDYRWLTPELAPLWRDFEPEHLRPLLDRYQIAGTIAVQAADSLEESMHLLALAAEHDWILGVVGW
ncbi:MAG: amidohydrolase family protein, partial [Planctomycetia bacterium]